MNGQICFFFYFFFLTGLKKSENGHSNSREQNKRINSGGFLTPIIENDILDDNCLKMQTDRCFNDRCRCRIQYFAKKSYS